MELPALLTVAEAMKVNGNKTKNMVMELKLGLVEKNMWENTFKTCFMARESTLGLMAENSRASIEQTKHKAKEL